MKQPRICFGITRHKTIIPLKVTDVKDFEDGCFGVSLELNHVKPSRFMLVQQRADFEHRFVDSNAPLCSEFSNVRETLDEAKVLLKKELLQEKEEWERKLKEVNLKLASIDEQAAEIEESLETKV
ncbi:hypothetical protein [Vibrio crassostreae]|uniref:hypothetical protein n=1 Tax=Vibrio crassostreae TaxID=246167 RepID=UPI001B306AB7|nr:hypothetical protein [Vibrio crassostreae]